MIGQTRILDSVTEREKEREREGERERERERGGEGEGERERELTVSQINSLTVKFALLEKQEQGNLKSADRNN